MAAATKRMSPHVALLDDLSILGKGAINVGMRVNVSSGSGCDEVALRRSGRRVKDAGWFLVDRRVQQKARGDRLEGESPSEVDNMAAFKTE